MVKVRHIAGALLLLAILHPANSATLELTRTSYKPPPEGPRLTVFVSDLHAGLGRNPDNTWNPKEDFRWHAEFKAFLGYIRVLGQDKVDLVIAGDFLELWQPPAGIDCTGKGADLGCTVSQAVQIVRHVARSHKVLLNDLRTFSEAGENRLHLIPGNHDATLLVPAVWAPVGTALNASSGRVNFVTNGVWRSHDGKILSEHGHQIGNEVNKYRTWPDIVRRNRGVDYIVRPWGEWFVQQIFNSEENRYPIIDNLSPETTGARFRMADRGVRGTASDIARLLRFNLFETSSSQKMELLGTGDPGTNQPLPIDIGYAREIGAIILLRALPASDPMRRRIEKGGVGAEALKKAIAAQLADPNVTTDEEIEVICEHAQLQTGDEQCRRPTAGAAGQKLETMVFTRKVVLQRHLQERRKLHPDVELFVYGHTHKYEVPWAVDLNGSEVLVANTGAFQRLIDEDGFLARLGKMTPSEGLRKMSVSELPPCYTALIVVPYGNASPAPRLIRWYMPPKARQGQEIVLSAAQPDDPRCK